MTSFRRPLAALIISTQLIGFTICQAHGGPTIPGVELTKNGQAKSMTATNPEDSLAAGAEIFENLTENSPELNAAAFDDSMTKYETLRSNISAQLAPDQMKRLDALLANVRKSWQKRDRGSMAIQSIEVYRLLQESINHANQPVPAGVPLLDYAGFKIKALLISKLPDWEQIRKTAHEATLWWASTKPKVTDSSLRDAMDHTIMGINEAVRLKDARLLTFAAEMELILVDGLESFFNSHPQNH
ncbi:MAG: hypothetical protein G3I10_02775 [Ferrovum sp.]|nr:hypothetical protein [Ferrovum sp.]